VASGKGNELMAIVERGEAFYVKVHRGRGRYEHVGTFRFRRSAGESTFVRVDRLGNDDGEERG
jgi:hypothetical protein